MSIVQKLLKEVINPSFGGIYNLYCSQPPEGVQDVLASHFGHCCDIHLYRQKIFGTLPLRVSYDRKEHQYSSSFWFPVPFTYFPDIETPLHMSTCCVRLALVC